MTVDRPTEYLIGLVHELRKLPAETERVRQGKKLKMKSTFCIFLRHQPGIHYEPPAFFADDVAFLL